MAIKKSLNEYQITVVGKQRDVNIPSGHRYVIKYGSIRGNEADDGYELWIEIRTYKDSNHTILLFNDLFPANNKTFSLGATLPTKSLQSTIATEVEKLLDIEIGAGKWTKIK